MPVPFLLIGAAAAAVIGVGGHLSAKETNEKAEKLYREAEKLYNSSKDELERNYELTSKTLEEFKNLKKEINSTTLQRFIKNWKKIRNSKFICKEINMVLNEEILKNSNMSIKNLNEDIYNIVNMGVVAGAGGAAYAIGGFALPVVAAPVVLLTAFFADTKAEENYQKAEKKYHEVEIAVEKMNIQIDLYKKINLKTKMFIKLLRDLNILLLESTVLMENMLKYMDDYLLENKIFKTQELNLIAFSRALAQTVKTVLDTSIIDKNGNIAIGLDSNYESLNSELITYKEKRKELL